MKFSALEYAQRELNYAIVDEVDSILIDEARTPLIISGQGEPSSHKYRQINEVIPRLRKDEHYVVDEKQHSVTLTDDGVDARPEAHGHRQPLRPGQPRVAPHPEPVPARALALQARRELPRHRRRQGPHHRRVHRARAPGRRWSDGLHQAVEAKENVRIQEETRTMATITFQNLFRLYKKLSGMTGTADTEAEEFHATYKLGVVVIPTNKPIRPRGPRGPRLQDRAREVHAVTPRSSSTTSGQPVLVGTTSVEKSNAIAQALKKKKIPHAVLNAKQHEREAFVVAQAGRKGAITVRPTWPAAARTSSSAATPRCSRSSSSRSRTATRTGARGVRRGRREVRGRVQEAEGEEVEGARRPPHPRHRAARVAPHRQPAPRPRRPPGRPGVEPLLPVARRRPDAHLRGRQGEVAHGAHGHAGRRAHRAPVGDAKHRRRADARSRSATSTSARTCSNTTT
jgi:hypothetical protein